MRWLMLTLCGLLGACQVAPLEFEDSMRVSTERTLPEWQSPRERSHPRVGKIVDLHSRAQVTVEHLINELADAPLVLLGEKHDNPDHHALQLWLLQALEARRPQGSVVMEMLTLDQQTTVSQVQRQIQSGEQAEDLPQALNWHSGWDWQQYAALVSHSLQQPYPLLAGNLNRDALMAIYRNPPQLTGVESTRADVIEHLTEQIREGHCNKLPEAQLPAMLAVQQQRDRSMAKVLLEAPKPTLLIAGAYHVRYDLGVPLHIHDLQNAEPLKQIVVILAEADQEVDSGSADFIWYTPAVVETDYCADVKE